MFNQIEDLASQMQNQINLGFQNIQLQMTQHFNETIFQSMMTQMRGVQESLHSDIPALDTRFDDMPTSEQFQQLEQRQQQLEQRFDTFHTASMGFSDHFYSIYPLPPLPSPMD